VTVAVLTNDNDTAAFPQTPGRVTIGIWCPACYSANPGLVGIPVNADFDTYVATVGTLEVINYNPATLYTYSDMSGLSSSVVIHHESTSKLTRGQLAGIVVAALGVMVIIVGALVYWLRCTKNTKGARDPRGSGENCIEPPEIVDDKVSTTADIAGAPRLRYPEGPELDLLEPGSLGRPPDVPPGGRLGSPPEVQPGGRLGQLSEVRTGGRLGELSGLPFGGRIA